MTTTLFVLALLIGFLTGIAFRDAVDLLTTDDPHSGRPSMSRIGHTASWVRDNVLTLAVVAAMVMNGWLGVTLIHDRDDLHQFVTCVAQYEQANAAAMKARSDAAVEVSMAMDRIVNAVYKSDAKKFKKAIRHYVKVRAAQDKSRIENPPPEPPKKLCGVPL